MDEAVQAFQAGSQTFRSVLDQVAAALQAERDGLQAERDAFAEEKQRFAEETARVQQVLMRAAALRRLIGMPPPARHASSNPRSRSILVAQGLYALQVLSPGDRVVLNIGGQAFTTTVATLRNATAPSLFSAMFSGRHPLRPDAVRFSCRSVPGLDSLQPAWILLLCDPWYRLKLQSTMRPCMPRMLACHRCNLYMLSPKVLTPFVSSWQAGAYFIDRDPRHFHCILNYLRVRRLSPCPS